MENRKMTITEQETIIKMMESSGWHYESFESDMEDFTTSLFFTIPLNETDKQNSIEGLKPNHFKPLSYRSVSIFNNYITSDIRGSYRRFRSRYWYNDKDTLNIFSYLNNEDDPIKNTEKFLKMYDNLIYNIS